MQIERLRLRSLTGTLRTDGPWWEDRMVRPIDLYLALRGSGGNGGGEQIDDRHFRMTQLFVEITATGGVTGLAGPVPPDVARLILSQLAPTLIGLDPRETELIWDRLFRGQPHGRQGDPMLALSAVDCALWDLRAKAMGQPVWRLLGGKLQPRVPAYASMLGFSVGDLGLVRDRALAMQARGFLAQKWFLRHGPGDGPEGMAANVALVRTLRETLGEGSAIMIDCWQSLTPAYAAEFCARVADFRLRWIEEPFLPDRVESHADLRRRQPIPVAGGEHDYTRWGMLRLVQAGALDVLQPDIYWAGGLSEMVRIAALASAFDLTLIPHGHSLPINAHFSAAQPPDTTPWIEYLVKWTAMNTHFLKPLTAVESGHVGASDLPGAAMELNPDAIEAETSFTL
jgi:L-alanine-DL-glutamate epimerase-like enolase superfamily enzyme